MSSINESQNPFTRRTFLTRTSAGLGTAALAQLLGATAHADGSRGRRGVLAGHHFSCNATENGVHVHDLQATILQWSGIDHEALVFRFKGRDFRLTDVHGSVEKAILL